MRSFETRRTAEGSVAIEDSTTASSLLERKYCRTGGRRRDYALGDALRAPSHAAIEPTPELAARAADRLRRHDFAFVRRSTDATITPYWRIDQGDEQRTSA